MSEKLRLNLALLLDGVDDERDQCVDRLIEQVTVFRGIESTHVDRSDGKAVLCLHYDPNLVTLDRVRRTAERAGAKVTSRFHHETVKLAGMDCADCAASIEHVLGRLDGVLNVQVSYAAEKLRVELDTQTISLADVGRRIGAIGYSLVDERPPSWLARNYEMLLVLLSGLLLAVGFFGAGWFGLPSNIATGCYVAACVAAGYDPTRHGLAAAFRLRFDIEFLMVVAALGAGILGEWMEGALLLFLFGLGHALEHYAMDRSRKAIESLGAITPKSALVRRDGAESDVPIDDLQRGDLVIVKNAERIPVDGVIRSGASAIDESAITGESVPVEKSVGDNVFAGCVNGAGVVEVEVTKLAGDTTLARVIRMVEEAQTQKSPTQRFTERFERVFVPLVLIGVVAMIAAPPLLGWFTFRDAFLRGMAILVSASPCALAIATPAAVLAGIAQAARNGVLIKGGMHLENLGEVRAIAVDKTGTITRGRPEVTDIVPLFGCDESELLRVAAAVESRSNHPLATAIVTEAETRGVEIPSAEDVRAVSGKGVGAVVEGEDVEVGAAKLFTDSSVDLPEEITSRVAELETSGRTTMIVRRAGRFLGIIGVADRPRPEATAILGRLKNLGVESLTMLTGDNERVALAIAEEVGVTEVRAGLMPDDKLTAIGELLDRFGVVAMVGDGVNDAPAMKKATVGIAMGAGGTDVALETADVALMGDELTQLPFAIGLSRQARRIIRQNLVVSLGVVAGLIVATVTGTASIATAIIFHEGSTLVVVLNGLRLLRIRPGDQ